MNSKIQAQYDELETIRKDILNELKKYPDTVLNKKPSPVAWSVLQVLDHLALAEESSLKYLQKKTLDASKTPVAGFNSAYRLMLVKVVFAIPRNFVAPQMLVPASSDLSLGALEQRWTGTRRQTFELLSKLPDADLKKEIWKHAVAGKMNIAQMYAFFKIHINRHRKQVHRTLKAVN